MSFLSFRYQDYIPKSIICLREGYNRQQLMADLFAGLSVGVISLPLALAFAIGSGVEPERGLFTAIVAGFLISLLGGSRVQIGGPTGAFVVIVFGIVQRHGYDGLAIVTMISGLLLILIGLARFGILLKFIPYPVTTGFTSGLAIVIAASQFKDFFGLRIDKLPPEFLSKCGLYCQFINTYNPWAIAISVTVLGSLFAFRHYLPRAPGAIIVIGLATISAHFFQLPVDSIESKFGVLPSTLPLPVFPEFTLGRIRELFPDIIAVTLLAAIESLLSAVIADGMTGHRHRSNCELVAQGFANIGSSLFGGIPATGAIARTSANIRLGAKTPISGMTHALTVLLLMMFFAPQAGKIPLCALSAVLVYVAWNMCELPHFIEIVKGPKSEAGILLITFVLTILIDLVLAMQVGVLLAAVLFLKRMTDKTTVDVCQILVKENAHESSEAHDEDILLRTDVPDDVTIFEIKGPFFYSVADLLNEALIRLDPKPKVFILRMRQVPVVDMTGVNAIKQFAKKCHKKNIMFLISGLKPDIATLFKKTGLELAVGHEHFFPHTDKALAYAKDNP